MPDDKNDKAATIIKQNKPIINEMKAHLENPHQGIFRDKPKDLANEVLKGIAAMQALSEGERNTVYKPTTTEKGKAPTKEVPLDATKFAKTPGEALQKVKDLMGELKNTVLGASGKKPTLEKYEKSMEGLLKQAGPPEKDHKFMPYADPIPMEKVDEPEPKPESKPVPKTMHMTTVATLDALNANAPPTPGSMNGPGGIKI